MQATGQHEAGWSLAREAGWDSPHSVRDVGEQESLPPPPTRRLQGGVFTYLLGIGENQSLWQRKV